MGRDFAPNAMAWGFGGSGGVELRTCVSDFSVVVKVSGLVRIPLVARHLVLGMRGRDPASGKYPFV